MLCPRKLSIQRSTIIDKYNAVGYITKLGIRLSFGEQMFLRIWMTKAGSRETKQSKARQGKARHGSAMTNGLTGGR